jgi:hypothetical protein
MKNELETERGNADDAVVAHSGGTNAVGARAADGAAPAQPEQPSGDAKLPWDDTMVARGLSLLGPTPEGGRPAYLLLSVAGTDLRDASPLARCAHVRAAALAGNRLRCVAALGGLAHLAHLDAAGNELTELLDLGGGGGGGGCGGGCCCSCGGGGGGDGGAGRGAAGARGARAARPLPPAAAGSLRSADFSRNRIAALRPAVGFTRLERLAADGNQVWVGGRVCVRRERARRGPCGRGRIGVRAHRGPINRGPERSVAARPSRAGRAAAAGPSPHRPPQVERLGTALCGLAALRELSLRDNRLVSCDGLQGALAWTLAITLARVHAWRSARTQDQKEAPSPTRGRARIAQR